MSKSAEHATKYQNVHYEEDTEYVIYIARILLKPIGIWPLPANRTLFGKLTSYLHTRIMFAMIFIFLIPQIIYVFYDSHNVTPYMKQMSSQVYTVIASVKFWTMIVNRKKIANCLTKMKMQYKNIECEEDRLIMTNSAKAGRFFTLCYLAFSYGGGLPYHFVLPLMSERVIREDNTTRLPLPYASDYVFFVANDSPIYEITFVMQILISCSILTTHCGMYSLIAALTMHSCCLFAVVSKRMETLTGKNREELRSRLNDILQHHMSAIKFAEKIEKSLSVIFLSEMLGGTLCICFCEYGIIMDWQNNETLSLLIYFILLWSLFLNVFIISFVGERLKQVSGEVGNISYFTQWYNHPQELANSIRMIILRTSHPSSLTAAKLFDLSLQGFCDVCKTSAAYLNFLRAVME